jgi:hypothetical protein
MTQILDGKALARDLNQALVSRIEALDPRPGLAVVRVGEDPASVIYVNLKAKAATRLGLVHDDDAARRHHRERPDGAGERGHAASELVAGRHAGPLEADRPKRVLDSITRTRTSTASAATSGSSVRGDRASFVRRRA